MNLNDFSQKRICVAISGGVDSVALLHYLKGQEKACGFVLSAVHCEHGIRGEESLADAQFVKELCADWQVPLYTFFEDCPAKAVNEKISLETAARNFRRACFRTLLEENKADFIATAHHKNDDAETVLFRLARGASLTGVGGMSEVNGKILRPFLAFSKAEIHVYAQENGLAYREDATNASTAYTRNQLRLEVLPKLEESVPGAVDNLVRFSHLAAEDDALLYEYAKPLLSMDVDLDGGQTVHLDFCQQKPLFRRACLLALKTLGVEKDYTALHLENAYALQKLQRGAKQTFPQGVEAERVEDGVLFYRKKTQTEKMCVAPKLFDKNGFDGGRYAVNVSSFPIEDEKNGWRILRVDGNKIPKNAVYRFRREGDEMERFGGGRKTLKKVFNEAKTPVSEREFLPLIADVDGKEVYVVCGVEISEKVKVTADTKETLYVAIHKEK